MAKKASPSAGTRKKSVKTKSASQAKPKRTKKKVAKPAAKKAKRESVLGRPKVTAEEMLYMLFKDDYHARQVFDFLRVQTVKELEQYTPQQIVKLLSRPIIQTVDRIRQRLAEKNRFLNDDVEFAVEFQREKHE